jgi:hypothetical protein
MPSAPHFGTKTPNTPSTTTTDETTTTFNNLPIGVEHPRRLVIASVYHGVAAACTATCNGTNMHRIQNTAHEFSIFFLQVPVGTTASISISATSSVRKKLTVFISYPSNPIPLDSGTDTANTTTNASVANLQVQYLGCLIYSGGQHATLGAFTTSWGGSEVVTETNDAQLEAAASYTDGYIAVITSTSTNALTLAETVSGTKRLVVGTWQPPHNY